MTTARSYLSKLASAQADARKQREDSDRLLAYNVTDIISEAEASALTPDLSPAELRFWQDDQRINDRGVGIDLDAVDAAIHVLGQAQTKYGAEMARLTGGLKSSEVAKLLSWLRDRGGYLDSLDEDAISPLLAARTLDPDVLRVLEIRALTASASVKKYYAMRLQTSAQGRLHDMYSYHGARTGRPTGSGVQSTNLPKAGPNVYKCGSCKRYHGSHTMTCHWCGTFQLRGPKAAEEWSGEAAECAITALRFRSLELLELLFGDVLLTLAGCLRGMFIPAPGHDFVSSDFTAIEGVVIACIAGEKWRVDAYAAGSPMYLLSAERMFGVSVQEMLDYAKANGRHHQLRQKGKGAELGLGFNGWINALRQFGVDGTDDELTDTVLKWRAASPNIEWFWGGQTRGAANGVRVNAGLPPVGRYDRWDSTPESFGLEGAAVSAVLNPGRSYPVLRLDGTPTGVSYEMVGDVLYCTVPSGGQITYHRPKLTKSDKAWRGMSLSFEGWNTNPKSGPTGWIRMNTYGGKLAENVVQKTARDIQMSAIARLEDASYPIVMHTYDEVVAEVPEGFGSVEHLEGLMTQELPWTVGWPIKAAGGWRGKRYQKA